jgi:alpha-ketoglutaric semialdehyde dehydrogenase
MFSDLTSAELNIVMAHAREAFLHYRKVSGQKRAEFLETIIHEIDALGAPLIQQAMEETNLPEARLVGERARTCNQLKQFADLLREGSWVDAKIDTALPDRAPLPKPDIRKMLVPLGPVVVFGASNFPFAYSTAGVDTASALAAGCPVVLKAHPAHPKTSNMVATAIAKAIQHTGMHAHVFQHVHGAAIEVGKALVQHPETKAVGFTGSFTGGKALYDYAQQRAEPIPVFSEMGSINPVILLPGTISKNAEKIAEQYAGSITLGVGQFCTNPGLLLGVSNPDLKKFETVLGDKMKQVAPAPMLHPGISTSFYAKRKHAVKQKAVTLVAQSTSDEPKNAGVPTLATVSANQFEQNPVLLEEVFGPYSLLVQADTMDELKNAIQKIPGQLTCTIMADEQDLINHRDVIDLVMERAGRVIINGVPTGVEVCPSMHHGGPFPATTDSRFTSVGSDAIKRFVRPVSFQNFPDALLPDELKNGNPLHIRRLINNQSSIDNV